MAVDLQGAGRKFSSNERRVISGETSSLSDEHGNFFSLSKNVKFYQRTRIAFVCQISVKITIIPNLKGKKKYS